MFMNNYMLTPKMPILIHCMPIHISELLSTFIKRYSDSEYNGIPQIILILINKDITPFMYRFDSGDIRLKVFNISSV